MKRFKCVCGSPISYDNTRCVSCDRELGWCPVCHSMAALLPSCEGQFRCGNVPCGARLIKCHNYEREKVCNRCLSVRDKTQEGPRFCDYCRCNDTNPILSAFDNREKWGKLEAAKRQLLYTLDLLRLPYRTGEDGVATALTFDFKTDTPHDNKAWWAVGDEWLCTGHTAGKITVNIREADSAKRDESRLLLREAHRTLERRFHHEIGHYFWRVLLKDQREQQFKTVFGEYTLSGYADAQERYCRLGPSPNWQSDYISAYATMHPWEDFAETFAAYLNVVSVLDTALHVGFGDRCDPVTAEWPVMLAQYVKLGATQNEMNQTMGLTDLVPKAFSQSIVSKMSFVHDLVRGVGQSARLEAGAMAT